MSIARSVIGYRYDTVVCPSVCDATQCGAQGLYGVESCA